MKQAEGIVRKRRRENQRKMGERVALKEQLEKMIERFDEHMKQEHREELEEQGKHTKLEQRALESEAELKAEDNLN